jgi:TatD DNase family protein
MRFFDTHAHLDFANYDADRASLIADLEKQEIGVLNPATDEASSHEIDRLTRDHSIIWGAVGLHPTDISADIMLRLPALLKEWGKLIDGNERLVAVGEIGLDYYHNKDGASLQKSALRQMLTFAVERNLPVIFHCRDAYGDLLTLLENYPTVRGVIHCFGGTTEQAEQFLRHGLHLSFTCNVTYEKNDGLRDVIRQTPIEQLMIETDAPFLSPADRRGERNDPRNVVRVAEVVAREKQMSVEAVAQQTTATAIKLFTINQ